MPKQRRFPTDVPWLHRGCALLHVDDTVTLEAEAVQDHLFPRQRFSKPVKIGVFFFGTAPEQRQFQPTTEANQPEQKMQRSKRVPIDKAELQQKHTVRSREGISFIVDKHVIPPDVCHAVAKIHVALGHPTRADLVRLLSQQGATPVAMQAAGALNCEFCERHRAPRPPPPVSAPCCGQFNDRLQCDIFYVHDLSHHQRAVLGIVDLATSYHVCRRINSRESHLILRAFTSAWLTPFGIPHEVTADADGAFKGECSDALTVLGIHLRHIPADAHHQLGKIERHNFVVKLMVRKMIDQLAVASEDQFDVALLMSVHAKNDMIRRAGRPPSMAVFGRCPRLPSQLMSDQANATALANVGQDERLAFADACRIQAIHAFASVDAEQSLRSAVLRQVPNRSAMDYQPGQKVAFFRSKALGKRGSRSKRAGYQLGTFVCIDPGTEGRGQMSSAWVQCGGRLIQVSVQQLRPAQGFETWNPSREDLRMLESAEAAVEQPLEDWTEHVPDQEIGEAEVIPEVPSTRPSQERTPGTPGFLPTLGVLSESDVEEENASDRAEGSHGRSSRIRPRENEPEQHDAEELPASDSEPSSKQQRVADVAMVENQSALFVPELDGWHFVPPDGYDGSPVVGCDRTAWQTQHDDGYNSTGDEHETLTAEMDFEGQGMSRAKQKAMQKELPWQWIVKQSPSFVQQFVVAAQEEASSWDKWSPLRPLSAEEVNQVKGDPQLRKRILRARGLYRDKNNGVGALRAKARIVVQGFEDPDLATVQRYAPVATRLALHTLLQFAASSLLTSSTWELVTADVQTAFLQGKQRREQPLFMSRPRDPILDLAHVFQDELSEIVGNVYGLVSAPSTFCDEVVKAMTTVAGATSHPLDKMFFAWRLDNQVCALALFHVDDLLITWDPQKFEIQRVRSCFEWGSWKNARETEVEYLGKAIQFLSDGILLHQHRFITNTIKRDGSRRGKAEDSVPTEDLTEFRSATGVLQWLAGSMRPDLAAATSLLQSSSPTWGDLRQLYEQIEYARSTSRAGIYFRPVPLENLMIAAYSDSSFANAEGKKSQAGLCLVLVARDATKETCIGSLIDWKSHRSRRVVRSTLSAEACAADAALDHAQYTSCFIGSVLNGTSFRDKKGYLPFAVLTDCRSLYDAVVQTTPSLEEKRCIIDVASIREALQENSSVHSSLPPRLHWCPTEEQMADALTKTDKVLRMRMTQWMMRAQVKFQDQKRMS
eukprot:4879021-Amphidinium_carterae.1